MGALTCSRNIVFCFLDTKDAAMRPWITIYCRYEINWGTTHPIGESGRSNLFQTWQVGIALCFKSHSYRRCFQRRHAYSTMFPGRFSLLQRIPSFVQYHLWALDRIKMKMKYRAQTVSKVLPLSNCFFFTTWRIQYRTKEKLLAWFIILSLDTTCRDDCERFHQFYYAAENR